MNNIKDFFIDPEVKNSEQVRRIGYEIVDLVIEHFSSLLKRPVFKYATPKELDTLFSEPVPKKGDLWSRLMNELREKVLEHSFHFGHPRYVGHMITQPAVPSIFIEPLIAALNQSVFLWEVGPSAAHLEKNVIAWLCKIFGYGTDADGAFITGGSIANLTALLIARNYILPGRPDKNGMASIGYTPVLFVSEYSHFSVEKAANFMGVGENNLVKVPVDKDGKMDPKRLEELIKESKIRDGYPFCVVATAGSTITGNIDPLPAIADLCRRYGLWFHVDAAFGGALCFSQKWRHLLNGIEKADSITFDPHKWLYNSISSATTLFRDAASLGYLQFKAPYIEEPEHEEGIRPNRGECTVQGTRAFDALKLWACLKFIGLDGYAQIIDHCMDMTHRLRSLLKKHADLEIMSVPEVNIICFRYNPVDIRRINISQEKKENLFNHINLQLQKRLEADDKAFLSVTTYKGKKVLRAVILNYCTTEKDLAFIVREVLRLGKRVFLDKTIPT